MSNPRSSNGPSAPSSEQFAAAYWAAAAGTGRSARSLLAATHDARGPGIPTWRLALAGLLELIDQNPEAAAIPAELVEPADALESEEAQPLRLWCRDAALAAFVRFDVAALSSLVDRHERVAGEHRIERAWLQRSRLLLELLSGVGSETAERANILEASARQLNQQALLVDALSLQALARLAAGETALAIDSARRAARRAREERLRVPRYFASVVLARVRRHAGRPHLAGRILSTLLPLLPEVWRGWLHWELELAGEPLRDEALPDSPSGQLVAGLRGLFAACNVADPAAFPAAERQLRSASERVGFLAGELSVLLSLLDASRAIEDCPPLARPFLRGEEAAVPLGLHGLVTDPQSSSAAPVAYLTTHPSPRRVLGVAAPHIARALNAECLLLSRLHAGRVDVALAVLAQAGSEGISEHELFRRCYGFRYAPRVHEAALGMLIHRVRARLPEAAMLTREAGQLALLADRPLLIPDPRCVEQIEGRLLRLVAVDGAITSRAAARSLGVSLRTVQAALARLVERSECVLDRSGRRIVYRVEDTSYTVPARLGGEAPGVE